MELHQLHILSIESINNSSILFKTRDQSITIESSNALRLSKYFIRNYLFSTQASPKRYSLQTISPNSNEFPYFTPTISPSQMIQFSFNSFCSLYKEKYRHRIVRFVHYFISTGNPIFDFSYIPLPLLDEYFSSHSSLHSLLSALLDFPVFNGIQCNNSNMPYFLKICADFFHDNSITSILSLSNCNLKTGGKCFAESIQTNQKINLQYLDLSQNNIEDIDALAESFKFLNSQLFYLNLNDNFLDLKATKNLFESIIENRNLHFLTHILVNRSTINELILTDFSHHITNLANQNQNILTYLDLGSINKGSDLLFQSLANNRVPLECLKIAGSFLDHESIDHFNIFLSNAPFLKELDISNTNMDMKEIGMVINSIQANKEITKFTLNISSMKLHGKRLLEFIKNFRDHSLNKWVGLNLEGNNIDSYDLQELNTLFQSMINLSWLNLSCNFTPSMKNLDIELANLLKIPRLNYIGLRGNIKKNFKEKKIKDNDIKGKKKISKQTILSFISSLNELTHPIGLDLRYNDFDDEAIIELGKAAEKDKISELLLDCDSIDDSESLISLCNSISRSNSIISFNFPLTDFHNCLKPYKARMTLKEFHAFRSEARSIDNTRIKALLNVMKNQTSIGCHSRLTFQHVSKLDKLIDDSVINMMNFLKNSRPFKHSIFSETIGLPLPFQRQKEKASSVTKVQNYNRIFSSGPGFYYFVPELMITENRTDESMQYNSLCLRRPGATTSFQIPDSINAIITDSLMSSLNTNKNTNLVEKSRNIEQKEITKNYPSQTLVHDGNPYNSIHSGSVYQRLIDQHNSISKPAIDKVSIPAKNDEKLDIFEEKAIKLTSESNTGSFVRLKTSTSNFSSSKSKKSGSDKRSKSGNFSSELEKKTKSRRQSNDSDEYEYYEYVIEVEEEDEEDEYNDRLCDDGKEKLKEKFTEAKTKRDDEQKSNDDDFDSSDNIENKFIDLNYASDSNETDEDDFIDLTSKLYSSSENSSDDHFIDVNRIKNDRRNFERDENLADIKRKNKNHKSSDTDDDNFEDISNNGRKNKNIKISGSNDDFFDSKRKNNYNNNFKKNKSNNNENDEDDDNFSYAQKKSKERKNSVEITFSNRKNKNHESDNNNNKINDSDTDDFFASSKRNDNNFKSSKKGDNAFTEIKRKNAGEKRDVNSGFPNGKRKNTERKNMKYESSDDDFADIKVSNNGRVNKNIKISGSNDDFFDSKRKNNYNNNFKKNKSNNNENDEDDDNFSYAQKKSKERKNSVEITFSNRKNKNYESDNNNNKINDSDTDDFFASSKRNNNNKNSCNDSNDFEDSKQKANNLRNNKINNNESNATSTKRKKSPENSHSNRKGKNNKYEIDDSDSEDVFANTKTNKSNKNILSDSNDSNDFEFSKRKTNNLRNNKINNNKSNITNPRRKNSSENENYISNKNVRKSKSYEINDSDNEDVFTNTKRNKNSKNIWSDSNDIGIPKVKVNNLGKNTRKRNSPENESSSSNKNERKNSNNKINDSDTDDFFACSKRNKNKNIFSDSNDFENSKQKANNLRKNKINNNESNITNTKRKESPENSHSNRKGKNNKYEINDDYSEDVFTNTKTNKSNKNILSDSNDFEYSKRKTNNLRNNKINNNESNITDTKRKEIPESSHSNQKGKNNKYEIDDDDSEDVFTNTKTNKNNKNILSDSNDSNDFEFSKRKTNNLRNNKINTNKSNITNPRRKNSPENENYISNKNVRKSKSYEINDSDNEDVFANTKTNKSNKNILSDSNDSNDFEYSKRKTNYLRNNKINNNESNIANTRRKNSPENESYISNKNVRKSKSYEINDSDNEDALISTKTNKSKRRNSKSSESDDLPATKRKPRR